MHAGYNGGMSPSPRVFLCLFALLLLPALAACNGDDTAGGDEDGANGSGNGEPAQGDGDWPAFFDLPSLV